MTDRRRFLINSGIGITGLMLSSNLLSSCASPKINFDILNQIPSDSRFHMKHLRGNVGYFTEKGGTIGWYADKKNSAVVDTQFPEQIENLMSQLLKFTDKNIEAVFNTHHHQDHTSGNVSFAKTTKKIIAHTNSKTNQQRAAMLKGQEKDILLPNIVFDNTFTEKVGKETIACQYFGAAHTDGDVVVHFQEANIAHLGDLVFNRRFPFIDMGAGANISNWVTVLDKVLATYDDNTIFLCGHSGANYGIEINKADIKAYQNYLVKLLDFGSAAYASGKTVEELKNSTQVIPGAEEWTGDGIDRSLDAVYFELAKKK